MPMREVLETGVGSAVTLQFDIGRDVWPVMVDVAEFETALVNLVINARDAMAARRHDHDLGAQRSRRRRGRMPADYVAISRRRYRQGHRARCARQDLRSLLHHQAGRQGHRARAVAGPRLRASGRRHGQGRRANSARAPRSRSCCRGKEVRAVRRQDSCAEAGGSGTVLLVEDNPEVAPSAPACSSNSAIPSAGWRTPKRHCAKSSSTASISSSPTS